MSKNIVRGAIVQLVAGSPKMTVKKVEGNSVEVQWFEGTQLKEAVFDKSAINVVLSEQILFG